MNKRMAETVAFIMVVAGVSSVLWYSLGNVAVGTAALIAACVFAIMLMFGVDDV